MKALLLLLSLFSLTAKAQVWVEQNAKWHYDFSNIAAAVGFYTIERSGDTIVGSQLCERYDVSSTRFWYYTQPPGSGLSDTVVYDGEYFIESQFTYISNDSVYRWDGNDFQLLFDFNAQVGDQWLFTTQPNPWTTSCTDSTWTEVIATGTQNIQGTNYRTITLSTPIDAPWMLSGTFNERFGEDYFFPRLGDYPCQEFIAEMDIISFKCFEDDSFSLYNPSGQDCEYYLTHLGYSDHTDLDLSVYPNPVSSELNIGLKGEFGITIYNMIGNSILEMKCIDNVKLDLLKYESGVYFIDISQRNTSERCKIIKL